MREYHRKRNGISRGVYYQVKGLLMDYDRLKSDRLDIVYGANYRMTGMPGGGTTDKTAQKAMRLAYIDSRLDAIAQASMLMLGERGARVMDGFDPMKAYWSYAYFNNQHIRTEKNPNGPCRRTWNNFKDRFSALIAEKLNLF